MLQSTNKFENIINFYKQQNQLNMIFLDVFDVCSAICKFFLKIYIATKEYSGVYYPTIQLIISHIFTDACAVMKIKFSKY